MTFISWANTLVTRSVDFEVICPSGDTVLLDSASSTYSSKSRKVPPPPPPPLFFIVCDLPQRSLVDFELESSSVPNGDHSGKVEKEDKRTDKEEDSNV